MKPSIKILQENYNSGEFLNFEEPFNKRDRSKLIYSHLKSSILFQSSSSAILCLTSFAEVIKVNYEPFPPNIYVFDMNRLNKESIKFNSNITIEFFA